ncbi:hypothetical protein [Brevibacterium album]|uniref:hypothetical protein n=1 Tax=Brevibacterium album TaxID=417948 RepID=UPI00042588A6|nr:hypothetical protein [Brevibacterium album]
MLHAHTEPRAGESAPFHLESHWHLPCSARTAWDVFAQVRDWPLWWPDVRWVREGSAPPGDPEHAGSPAPSAPASPSAAPTGADPPGHGDADLPAYVRLGIGSPLLPILRLRLRLTGLRPPYGGEAAVTGDLRGSGAWRARDTATGARIDLLWCVVTHRRALRFLRPLGIRAHRAAMRRGRLGLISAVGSVDAPRTAE